MDNSSTDFAWTKVDSWISPKNTEVKRLTGWHKDEFWQNVAGQGGRPYFINTPSRYLPYHRFFSQCDLVLFPQRGGVCDSMALLEPGQTFVTLSTSRVYYRSSAIFKSRSKKCLTPCDICSWGLPATVLCRIPNQSGNRLHAEALWRCSVWHPRWVLHSKPTPTTMSKDAVGLSQPSGHPSFYPDRLSPARAFALGLGCWERLKTEEEDYRGWDDWMASPVQWTWT